MTLMDADGNTSAAESEVVDQALAEDYNDFTNPTNLLRTPSWVSASPEARPALVDRAMNAFLKDLEVKKDKRVDSVNAKGEPIQAPVWTSAGTLTGKGQEYVDKARQLFQTAAQDPEGGIYQDDYSGKWETSAWVDDFTKAQPKPKAFDPLADLEDWRKETSALGDETNLAAQSWQGFVEHSNAKTTDPAAQIDPDNKELKKEWARRMSLADFKPGEMGATVIQKVGGQYIINPDDYGQIDNVEASIEALEIPESEKRLMRLQHRDLVEKNAATLVNAFASADAGTIGGMFSRPLNDEFNEAMSKPGASAYEFIRANKERFNKDNYGVSHEVADTFRDSLMATGTAALWVGSGGEYTAPMEAFGGLAADTAKAYNNTKQFEAFGVDIGRRDLTELTGQIGSFVAMGMGGALAGRGLVKAGAAGASRYAVSEGGQLVSRAVQAASQEAMAAGLGTTKTFGQKVAGLGKALSTDPEMILGSLQAAGTSYGRTFNDTFEQTGDREQAHKQATVNGVADGLSALIATGVMNRFSAGAGKFLGMSEDGVGVVQNIRSRVSSSAARKEVSDSLEKLATMTPELRRAVVSGLGMSMDETAKKLGLRGLGILGDAAAEGVEESMDEVISGAIQSMSDDSKSWSDAEWEQIQNNWQGYVKAGILGAIGGTAGGAQNAGLSPKQVFGKSDALQVQEGLWKAIKAKVDRFDSPGMVALDGRTDGVKSVAEVLGSNMSVQDKSDILIATARGKNFANFTSALSTASAPVSASEPQPEASKPSLSSLMEQFGNVAPEGTAWNNSELTEDASVDLGKLGSASIVSATDEKGTALPVAVKVTSTDGTVSTVSAEQFAQDHAAAPEAVGIIARLANSGKDALTSQFTTKIETDEKPEKAEVAASSAPKAEAPVAGSSAEPAQPVVPKSGEPLAAAKTESKEEIGSGNEPLTSRETNFTNRALAATVNQGHSVETAPKPKVTRKSIPGSTSMRSSHVPEMVGTEESGLWIDAEDRATVEPRLMRELIAKHSQSSKAAGEELAERIAALKKSIQGSSAPTTLNAKGVKEQKAQGSALDAVDPEAALIVASDTIEQSQADEAGGQWERVDIRPKNEVEQAKDDVVQDGLGEDIVYTYTPPKGQSLSVNVGKAVLIQGEPESILILDEVKDGKWVFRKVDVSPDSIKLKTLSGAVRNINHNRMRLIDQAKQAKPLLTAIATGTVTIPQLRALFGSVMDGVAPNFKSRVQEVDLSAAGDSYLRANLETGKIEVDFNKLKTQLHLQYRGVNTSSEAANEALAADVVRIMAYWVDEETLHLLTKDTFKNAELIKFYNDIASNLDHPFHKLLQETVDERLKDHDIAPDSEVELSVVGVGGRYQIAAELIRKLHQLKHSGSYSERATYESQILQASVNMDADEMGKIGKLVNTVTALVKRYSDRIRNILAMRWAMGQLPRHQQQMLLRLEQAYRLAGVNGDTNFAREDVINDRVQLQREFATAHLKWGNKVTAEHFEATNNLREAAKNFENLTQPDMLQIDPETLALSLRPGHREYLEKYDPKFAPKEDGSPSAAMEGIDALLEEINDTDPATGEVQRPGIQRARDLIFLNRQVMEARMAAMDFDVTPALELGGADAGNTLRRIATHIENTVSAEDRPEHYKELSEMWWKRANAIQDQIELIHKGIAETERQAIDRMSPSTNSGRRQILATAKELGLESPFDREGINPNDVTAIMERLKRRVTERSANLAQHSASRVPTGDESFFRLTTLGAELAAARRSAMDAEAKFITAQDTVPSSSLPSERMGQFLAFNAALKEYNKSVKNYHRLAFGDIWERPAEFGNKLNDMNTRTGRGDRLVFPTSSGELRQATSEDDVFGVKFEKTGRFLGFRPKLHFFEEGKGKQPLTKEQLLDNEERAVIEVAGNNNAAFIGRMLFLNHFVDYVDGKFGAESVNADLVWNTGGFSLPKDTNSEIGADRYRSAGAFRTQDVKLFNGLVFAASNEAGQLAKGKGNKAMPARQALIEHVKQMEEWAAEALALVGERAEDVAQGFAPSITALGGRQTLAGRVKPLIEDQFARKGFLRQLGEETETNGLIALLDELHLALTKNPQDHKTVASELFDGIIVDVRRRLDGANDAARLTNKSLTEFKDQVWRDNVAMEGSRVQRQASFVPDNPELLRLRDAPIDARILANLSWLMKFHEKSRDYAMGSNFAFELLEMINRGNRGEGVMPMIYDKAGNMTDPNIFDEDKRTNRPGTVESMLNSLDGDRVMTAGEVAIDRAAQPENSRRMALTAAGIMIGSQSNGDSLDIDGGRAFLFDLWAMENGNKSRDEQRQLIRKGIRGTFPLAKNLANPEAFYDEMMKELSYLEGQTPSMETVLVSLLELKQGFEASIVEQAKAGQGIGRALAAVKLAISPDLEVLKEIEEEVDQVVPNPDFNPEEDDSPFSNKRVPRTLKQKVKVKKVVKVKATQFNSLASPEEAEGIARMIKGEMLKNGPSFKDPVTKVVSNGEALTVYDASMLIHGIDGIGNALLSNLVQNLPGTTLVVSPSDNQRTRYGMDDVGLKIFRGTDGQPNVVYAPQSQKNPEKNATESFGGIAQTLLIAAENPATRERINEMYATLVETLQPAAYIEGISNGLSNRQQAMLSKLPEAERESVRNEMLSHLEDVAELGRLLNAGGDFLPLTQGEALIGQRVTLIAEVLTNPRAKELFDKSYIGLDSFQDTLLAEPVELSLHDGLRNILRVGSDAETFDGDFVDNATDTSVETADDEDGFEDVDVDFTRPDVDWMEKMHARLAAGEMTAEEEEQMLSLDMGGERVKEDNKPTRKRNKYGADAAHLNGTLKGDRVGNSLNPSDAFLFNGLARIMELGKAAGGAFPMAPVNERATSEILNRPLDPTGQGLSTDKELIAKAGPALQGNVKSGAEKATQIYVGEMRNLTIPKVAGSTAHNIAFQKRNIDSTNSSLLLRAGAVRSLVGAAVRSQAVERLSGDADSSGFGRVDVALPLTQEMFDSIAAALPAGVLQEALAEAKASLASMEADEARLVELREKLLAEIGSYEADNGQVFQDFLDNSQEGANLLAAANEWSESLKQETRDTVVDHVIKFSDQLVTDSKNSANLGHVVHSMLTSSMENNSQLKAAVDGLYKQADQLGALIRERNALLTPDENNELPQGDLQGINSRISDAARLFNLHAALFNTHAEQHALQVMRWTGVDAKTANLSGFKLKPIKDTDEVSFRDSQAAGNQLAGMLNGQKFAQGFMNNMVRQITQGVAMGAKPKAQTNAFMRMVADEIRSNPGYTKATLSTFVDEKLNEALNDEEGFAPEFQQAINEIALTTNQARALLSGKARTAEQEEGRKQATIYLQKLERELTQIRKELGVIDTNEGEAPVGMGYYSDRVAQGNVKNTAGKVVTKAFDRTLTMGARLTLTDPSRAATGSPSVSNDAAGTLSRREFWTRQKAVISALTEQSENRIEDAYKFVRGSRDQFMNFDPLKAINQAVDLVNLEEQTIREVMQDARSDAFEAKNAGLTADAAAYLTHPDEAETYTATGTKVRRIHLPKSGQLRRDKLGILINQDGEKVVMLPLNARELLMQHFPQITKRNVNREIEKIILDALPVNQGAPAQGSYSYFLNGTKAEEGKAFNGSDFSPAKTGLTKGEAAKVFVSDWKAGMQTWLDDAMNMTVPGRTKRADLTGDLAQAQLDQFGYMIDRLVISHGDPRLSADAQAKVTALLKSIDSGAFSEIGGDSSKMDVSRMLAFRVEPVFSQVFAEIEAEAIQKRLIMDFVSFDGKKHGIELGALKYLHHQDARIRSKFRRNYAARQAAIHLNDFLEYGIDGQSGRKGYTIAKKRVEKTIADAATPLKNNAKNQTIGYLLAVMQGVDSAFGLHKEMAANLLFRDIRQGLNQLENLNAAQGAYFGTLETDANGNLPRDAKGKVMMIQKKGVKALLPTLNRYWNADNLDMVRDIELAREVRTWLADSGADKVRIITEADANEAIEKFTKHLVSQIEGDKDGNNLKEVENYAKILGDQFSDISSAMQLTMAMLSRDAAGDLPGQRPLTGEAWQDDERQAFKRTYSSVPLRIGFAAQPDPAKRQSSSDRFVTDPIDIVSLKDSSFFGGFGKGGHYQKDAPFRPISVNGLTAPLSLIDDAIYKLNVTPTYEVLRRSFGRLTQDEHGVNSIKDGDFLTKSNSLVPTDIDWKDPAQRKALQDANEENKKFREALSVIAGENETILQNDAANGVVNTGGAEVMRFLGSAYIVRALASAQQIWDQTASPSVGYATGKIAAGKGKHAAQYFRVLQQLIINRNYEGTGRSYNEIAREFIRGTDPSVYYRSADGADVARDVMKRQVRFSKDAKGRVKNKIGKGIRKYEEIGEKALQITIGTGEHYLATAMYLVELADQMGLSNPNELLQPGMEPTAMAKSNARRKVNDVMAQSDQSKKSWMFQNRTTSPGRNALWRSMVRFSNHTSSVASNTSVMVPVIFDSKADAETKQEAVENVVTSLVQNILFNPFKIKTLVPMVAYLLYLAGGDDDDKAQKKAQKAANYMLAVDKDSGIVAELMKTILLGKQKEFFDSKKTADAAQTSAFAELLSKSMVEVSTAVPVLGVLAGYSPVSGLLQRSITNPAAISTMTNLNNAAQSLGGTSKRLTQASSQYDKNATTIRQFEGDWDQNLASLTAPTQLVHDIGSAAWLSAEHNMTTQARHHRLSTLLDTAIYGAMELIPFARDARGLKKAEIREEVRKDEKRK